MLTDALQVIGHASLAHHDVFIGAICAPFQFIKEPIGVTPVFAAVHAISILALHSEQAAQCESIYGIVRMSRISMGM